MLGIMMKMAQVIQPDNPAINVDWEIDENARRAEIKVTYNVEGQFVARFLIDVDKVHGRIVVGEVETVDNQPDPVLFTPIAARFRELVTCTGIKLVLHLPEDPALLEGQPYKLYVWHDVLSDNTAGVIFAMARSLDEARQAVIMNALQDSDYAVKRIEEETMVEPEVYDGPVSSYMVEVNYGRSILLSQRPWTGLISPT